MLPVRWSEPALEDLDALVRHVAQFNVQAAFDLQDRFIEAVLPLSEHPNLFRQGRVAGTRELVAHPNYIIVYQVFSDRVEITKILHARQLYP